jgi:hypothetical protein
LGWLLAGPLGVASVAEVLLITMQRWRGVPSHFNEATAFDAGVFNAMGVMVAVAALVIAVVTVLSFTSLRAAPSMVVAIRVGLVLLVAGQLLGGAIIANGMGKSEAQAIAAGSTFGAAGGMKVPHAVSLHAVQLLPALAWLLGFTVGTGPALAWDAAANGRTGSWLTRHGSQVRPSWMGSHGTGSESLVVGPLDAILMSVRVSVHHARRIRLSRA